MQLSNSDFSQNQANYYNELLESQEMSDITLACDGFEIGVHKTIISASSLFLREIIRKSKHASQYIYLRGVSQESLKTLLKFIYLGEATARTENLQNLIEAGNELQIVGIMEEPSKSQAQKGVSMHKGIAESNNVENIQNCKISDFVKIEIDEDEMLDEQNEQKEESSSGDLMTEIKKKITEKVDDTGKKTFSCTVCGKECSKLNYIKHHVETHLEGFSHKCKYCDVVKPTKKSIQQHQWKYHTSARNETEMQDGNSSNITTNTAETNDTDKKEEVDDESNPDLEEEIAKKMTAIIDGNKTTFKCTVCQKETRDKTKMKFHVETHLKGYHHKCKFCGQVKTTRGSLYFHVWDKHTRTRQGN